MSSHLIEGPWYQRLCSVDSIIAIRDVLRSEFSPLFSAMVCAVVTTLRAFGNLATKSDSRLFLVPLTVW